MFNRSKKAADLPPGRHVKASELLLNSQPGIDQNNHKYQ